MHLGLRLLFAFVVITGLAAFFVLRVFVTEIKPSVAEVLEDVLVDSAHLLAELAAPELAALPDGAVLAGGPFAAAVKAHQARPLDARIAKLKKTTLDLRVLVTDLRGRVVFDSGQPAATGQDYSRWRDVARTLRGEYGARMSRDDQGGASSVMYVAAPVKSGQQLVGTLVLAKPMATIAPFVERAERKVLGAGALLLGLSLAIGVAVTLWTVHSVRRLKRYAQAVGSSEPLAPAPAAPTLPGELGDLAGAMDQMRQRLQNREHLEHTVRALTHELKSPLAAIRGAAELLQDDLPEPDRRRFVQQVDDQALRLQTLVERLLELSKLESLAALPATEVLDLAELTDTVLAQHAAAVEQRGLGLRWLQREATPLAGDRERLMLAISNVLNNALQHAPANSALELSLVREGSVLRWSLRDPGPGVPAYALPQLGERFFTTGSGGPARGSGLGLAIARQVVLLHGGKLHFESAAPGLRVIFELPLAAR